MMSRLIREEDGQSMIEYGLLASLIAVAAIASLKLIGPKISAMFSDVASNLGDASPK